MVDRHGHIAGFSPREGIFAFATRHSRHPPHLSRMKSSFSPREGIFAFATQYGRLGEQGSLAFQSP